MVSKKIIFIKLTRVVFLTNILAGAQLAAHAQMPQNASHFMSNLPNMSNPNLITSGTVLTGVLQEDISSKKNKAADIFSIMLPENYIVNDRLLIPQYSKFVGSIVSVSPAKKARHGNPGNLQVSIQTLVSPDGASIPVNAFIDYNPNENNKINPKKSSGIPLGQWGKSAAYSLFYLGGSFGSRAGVPSYYNKQTKGGKDFSLSKGELLPVRLTQSLDVTPLLAKNVQTNMPNLERAPLMPAINQTNDSNSAPNIPSGTNLMPGVTNPAGPEPF
jgi:hypothetical protein